MSPHHARSLLTKAAIDITVRTLVALDALQAHLYRTEIAPSLKAQGIKPLDSDEWELAKSASVNFVTQCPSGNNQGVRMNSSAFINGIKMLGMDEGVSRALEICESFDEDEK